MSDTPQNDEPINEAVNEEVVTNDSVLESDTSSPVQAESTEQVDEVAVAQEKATKAFNKQYGEKKQLERDLAAQREVNNALQQADRDRQAAAVGDIPPMPDSFDDDFDAKIKIRDDAIIAKANHTATNNAYLQQQQNQQQQAQQAQQAEFNKSVITYSERATELGIGADELQQAGNVVGNYGLSGDLIKHILSDPDGPLITKHLAANPMEAHELANMSPYAIGSKLDAIKSSAAALKPKQSNTPAPIDGVKGNGVTPGDKYKHISGAKFY
jgi:hypothetical protein